MNHYWIDPKGKIYYAPKGHIDFVTDHASMFGVPSFDPGPDYDENDYFDDNFDKIMKDGWVRIFNFHHLLEVTVERSNKKLFDKLMIFLVNTRGELPKIEKVTVISLSPRMDQYTYSIGSVDKLISGETSFNESLDESYGKGAKDLKKLYGKYINEAHTIYGEAKEYERKRHIILDEYTLLSPKQKKKIGSTYMQGGYFSAKFFNDKKKLHREDGPAYITTWGLYWMRNDMLHREDGPASIETSGAEFWVNGKKMSQEEYEKHFDLKESQNRDESFYKKQFRDLKMNFMNEAYEMFNRADVTLDPTRNMGKKKLSDEDQKRTGAYSITVARNLVNFRNENGKLHREDGKPARYDGIGSFLWIRNGKLHREDGPAIIGSDGSFDFFINGKKYTQEEFLQHFDIKESLNESKRVNDYEKEAKAIWDELPPGEDYDAIKILSPTLQKQTGAYRLNKFSWVYEFLDRNNNLHRKDGPAYINSETETIIWYNHGEIHRDNGPAYTNDEKSFERWFKYGELHRLDGPASIDYSIGLKMWYKHGKLHREGGPAVVNQKRKSEAWYKDGKLHREDGPAFTELSDPKVRKWYVKGNLHRTDGPAIEYFDQPWSEFYVNGKKMNKEEFLQHFDLKESDNSLSGDEWRDRFVNLFNKYGSEAREIVMKAFRIRKLKPPYVNLKFGHVILPEILKRKHGAHAISYGNKMTEFYFLDEDGEYSRLDGGPAEIKNGMLRWSIHGRTHKDNGPAVIYAAKFNGAEFWVNGREMSQEEFEKHFDVKEFLNESSAVDNMALLNVMYHKYSKEAEVIFKEAAADEELNGEYTNSGSKPSILWLTPERVKQTGSDYITIIGSRYSFWKLKGKGIQSFLHRLDGPAEISPYSIIWKVNGKSHREDGIAEITKYGGAHYFINDKRMNQEEYEKHFDIKESLNEGTEAYDNYDTTRSDRLKIIQKYEKEAQDFLKTCMKENGSKNRENGQEAIPEKYLREYGANKISFNQNHGTYIFLDDRNRKNRLNGPSYIARGYTVWYRNDILHREDGPAIVNPDADLAFYVNGVPMHKEEYEKHFDIKESVNESPVKVGNYILTDFKKIATPKEKAKGGWDTMKYSETFGDVQISYFKNGKYSRIDGPAVISESDKLEEWWLNGKRHREGGPAVINGHEKYEEWWVNGKLHRDGGPAFDSKRPKNNSYFFGAVVKINGVTIDYVNPTEIWAKNGKFYREGGLPTIVSKTEKLWFVPGKNFIRDIGLYNGVLHREDGPAYVNNKGQKAYFINGKQMTEREYKRHFDIKEDKGKFKDLLFSISE